MFLDLLKMNVRHDIEGKKGKGCSNVSDYAKMAMQGGHKGMMGFFFSSSSSDSAL